MNSKTKAKWALVFLGGVGSSCIHPAVIDSGDDDETGSGGSVTSTGGQASEGTGGQAEVVSYCPIGTDVAYDPDANYPFCQLSDLRSGNNAWTSQIERCRYSVDYNSQQEIDGAGVGMLGWVSVAADQEDADPMNFCTCMVGCRLDEDCASPETGSAQAACVAGSCVIRCEEGETCPDGMQCSSSDEFGTICGWGTRGTGCDTTGWPQVSDPLPAPVCPLNDEIIHNPAQSYAYCQGDPNQGPGLEYCGNQHKTLWEPSHTKDCFNCDACFCQTTCVDDSDCPAGETGTATERCMKGACVLSCNDDESCPDGMTCTTTYAGDKKVCGWVSGNGGCEESKFNF